MKCTNCGIETIDSGDIHCRKIFKNEFEDFLKNSELKKAIDYYKSFVFKDKFSNEWKKDRYGKDFERLVKKEESKKIKDIGLKIKNKIVLSENEILILKNNKKDEWLGYYYNNLYLVSKNLWDLVMACSFYRTANKPENVLLLTKKIIKNQDKIATSAIYTTKGGAYRDLNKLDEAIECAREAIKINNSYYPYTLLGAIYIQKESFSKAKEYFEKAIELGSDRCFVDQEIQRASLKLSIQAKKEMNKFFKNKYLVFKK